MWRVEVDAAGSGGVIGPLGADDPMGHRSDVDQALDPLDRERPAGRRVDVDLGGVEDDGPLPTSKRVGSALMKRGRTVAGSKPMTESTGPVMPRSLT